jgi:hypothetical protein
MVQAEECAMAPDNVPIVECNALSMLLAEKVCTEDTPPEDIYAFLMANGPSIQYICLENLQAEQEPPPMRGGPEACEGFTTYSSTSGSLSIRLDNSTGSARSCSFLIMPEWFYEAYPAPAPPPEYAPPAATGSNVIPPPRLLTTPSVDASVTFLQGSDVICKGAQVAPGWVLTTASCCDNVETVAKFTAGLFTVFGKVGNIDMIYSVIR